MTLVFHIFEDGSEIQLFYCHKLSTEFYIRDDNETIKLHVYNLIG